MRKMSVEVTIDGKYVVILSGDIEVVGVESDTAIELAEQMIKLARILKLREANTRSHGNG